MEGGSCASGGHAKGIEKVSCVVRSLDKDGKTSQHEEKPKKEGNGKAGRNRKRKSGRLWSTKLVTLPSHH